MNLLDLMVRIGVDDQASSRINGIAGAVGSGMAGAAKAVGAAMAAGTAAVGGFAVGAVNAGMDFDSSMSQVAATMGKTVDEIGELRTFAQEMGASTAFSATQAADALNYMALAGYDAETSMNMLPNVLNLAAAGGIDLAEASDMVTDAQSALGLSLEQTSTMVDQMAKASSTTNTSVAQLGSAMLTIGGTAKSLSGGTAELSQALGLLADNGIKGAEGGTALRNIMLNLQPKTEEAAAAMEKIGLNAYDAEGKMRPLKDIFLEMNEGMADMTDEEKQNVLSTIFNKVDLKSINALMGTNAERWDEVAAAIGEADGAAQAMAETQLDNLAGDITLLKSAFEGFQIAVSDQATPALREFAQFGGEALQTLTTALNEGGFDGLLDALDGVVSDLVEKVAEFIPPLLEAAAAVVGAVVSALPGLLQTLLPAITEMAPSIIEAGMQMFVSLVEGLAMAAPQIVEGLLEMLGTLVTVLIQYAPQLLEATGLLLLGILQGIAQAIAPAMEGMNGVVEGMLQAIGNFFGDMFSKGGELIGNVADGVAQGVSDMATAAGDAVQGAIDAVGGFFKDMWDAGANLIAGLAQGIASAPGKVVEAVTGAVNGAIDEAKKLLGIASPSKVFRGIGENTMLGLEEGILGGSKGVRRAMDGIMGSLSATPSLALAGAGMGGAHVDNRTYYVGDVSYLPDSAIAAGIEGLVDELQAELRMG